MLNMVKIVCPTCFKLIEAQLDCSMKFFVYCCPVCSSNVVSYDNKVDVLSDRMIEYLKKTQKLKFCGKVVECVMPVKNKISGCLSNDQLTDLRILLETSKDSKDFLSKI